MQVVFAYAYSLAQVLEGKLFFYVISCTTNLNFDQYTFLHDCYAKTAIDKMGVS